MWMCVTLWSRMLSTSCLIPCPCVVYVIRGNKDILIDWLIDRSLGCLTLIRPQQLQEQQHPFLSACAAFSCVQTMVWLPVFRVFNVRADVNARDCTQGLYTQHKKSALKGDSGRKNPLHISLGNQTHISIVLGFSACCSTHWAYLKKCIPPTWNFGGHVPRANKCSPWGFSAMRHIGQ